MRLCFVANPNLIHTQRWLHYFASQGQQVYLIGEHKPEQAVPPGVTFYDLTALANLRGVRYLAWAIAARRLVRRIGPDLLHAHQVASAGWLGAAADYHPFMVTAWGSDLLLGPGRSRVQRLLARWVLCRADWVSCVSQGLALEARRLGADPGRLEVAPWGVDLQLFHPGPPPDTLRSQLGLGPGPLVLSLRAMRAIYRPLDIAQAIPRVLDQIPSAQFVIRTYSCDPALFAQFRAIVEEQEAAGGVRYVADLPDDQAIAGLYRLADVAVSVPSSDGTPQSVLEALACGVVPVLSDLPSLGEWVRHEREALLVPVGDVDAVAAAIVRLLTDEALCSRMAARAVELIRERGDSRVWMRHCGDTYRRLVGGAGQGEDRNP